jgi:myo-inositol-1(or 4)-monophosphatase
MKKAFLKDTLQANKEIYFALQQGIRDDWQKEHSVGAGGDVSTGLDLFAESIFIKYLAKYGKIESEEAGEVGEGEYTIVIDPLDGSSNAFSNFPYYGSSVALIDKNGKLKVAVVCNLANGDIFYKFKGKKLKFGNLESSVFFNEKCIKKSKIGIFERSYSFIDVGVDLVNSCLKYRAPGAVALSLAYAHRVNFVLYMGDIRIYDFAAGLGLCDDLQVSISKDYVIVSKDKDTVKKIESIITN